MTTIPRLTIDDIDTLTVRATQARPTDTDATGGVDVSITLMGAVAITGDVTVTPMASGQGFAANAPALDAWVAAGPLLELLETQSPRERRELVLMIEGAAAHAAEALEN